MDEHERIGELLGPYLLGELDPEERADVERHLSECPRCRAEERSLRRAHEALRQISTPPQRELGSRVPPVMRRRRLAPLLAAAAVLLVIVAGTTLYFSGALQQETASATLEPTAQASPQTGGEVRLYESGANVRVEVEVWGMPEPGPGGYYELWFSEEGEMMNGATFTTGPDGRVKTTTTAPGIARGYPTVGVTAEKTSGNPGPSDTRMLEGSLEEK